jgi:hypothetical protein
MAFIAQPITTPITTPITVAINIPLPIIDLPSFASFSWRAQSIQHIHTSRNHNE